MNSTLSKPAPNEAQIMHMLGKLTGALEYCSKSTKRIFAAKMLRNILLSALRQEQFQFTEIRFEAWFAGLSTLTDTPNRTGIPPQALCRAILTELTLSSWPPLSFAAAQLLSAFLAPSDLHGDASLATAQRALTKARDIVLEYNTPRNSCPLQTIGFLYQDLARHSRYLQHPFSNTVWATKEGTPSTNAPSTFPPWALELVIGEALKSAGWLTHALPFPNAINTTPVCSLTDEEQNRNHAECVQNAAQYVYAILEQATKISKQVDTLSEAHRSTSRAPYLYEILSGFGALRSTQIERIFGLSRLGVRGVISSLQSADLIQPQTVSGSILHCSKGAHTSSIPIAITPPSPEALSDNVIAEYKTSLAEVDRLLDREGDNVPAWPCNE